MNRPVAGELSDKDETLKFLYFCSYSLLSHQPIMFDVQKNKLKDFRERVDQLRRFL